MGKWTSQHYDDVLGSKIKSLVTGSIRRAELEDRAGHTISYKQFVEELDAGDSFTTSLVDVLVQEVSTRRARQNAEDKRLISDVTSRGLRMLAAPSRVYRPRPTRVGPPPSSALYRRGFSMNEYLAVPSPDDLAVDEDGDSTDSALDPVGAVEGARLNSEIWDAMGSVPTRPSSLRDHIRRSRPDLPYPTPPPPVPAPPLHHALPSINTSSARPRFLARSRGTFRSSSDLSELPGPARRTTAFPRSDEHEHDHEEPALGARVTRRGFQNNVRRNDGWTSELPEEYTAWSPLPSIGSPTDGDAPALPSVDEPIPGLETGPASRATARWRHTIDPVDAALPWHTAFESGPGVVGRRHAGARSSSLTRETSAWGRADESW
ncbi:unnamed protein product [Peniophora sp. CBMAI 1063]|nr:unnamed protein product [Peniophora sp. CBMAI 1063]